MNEMNAVLNEDLKAAGETKMNVSVEFSLLSAVLEGAVEKNEKGIEFLVMPQQKNGTDEISLNGIVDGINGFFKEITDSDEFKLDADKILEKLKEIIKNVALEITKFTIKQVFIHFSKPKDGEIQLEYAFSIGIDFTKEMLKPDLSFGVLRSLTFGIWNTDNQKVLSKMGLLNISEQLALIGE